MAQGLTVGGDVIFRSFRKKLSKSFQTRGVVGTLAFSARMLVRALRNLTPSRRKQLQQEREGDEDFDRRYGVDTSGHIPLSNLSVAGDNWVFGVHYEPLAAGTDFDELLRDLDVDYERSTFIDMGSGKGRAVLKASMLPFARVIGVEFAEELHRIAEENVRRWPEAIRRCARIELACSDAASYVLPDSPIVLFLYNPFDRPVMDRVVNNVSADLQAKPRRFIILYFTPKHADLWERVSLWKKVTVRPGVHVFDTAAVRR